MKVQEFLKGLDAKTVVQKFESDYDIYRDADFVNRIQTALDTIAKLTPTKNDLGEGVLKVEKFVDNYIEKDQTEPTIYVHSSIVYPNEPMDYGYFDQSWSDICNYEVFLDTGVDKLDAQVNIVFEMTYMGTTEEMRKENIDKYFDETPYLDEIENSENE